MDIRAAVVYGGAPSGPQISQLRAGCDILVATPGRLIDFIDRQIIGLSSVQFFVLDEADRM